MDQKERRRHQRYTTNVEVIFRIAYDVKTRVDFQVVDQDTGQVLARKYTALSRNVSLEGLSFSCDQPLKVGDQLYMEINLSADKEPTKMLGEVRWAAPFEKNPAKFAVGVNVITVNGKNVSETFQRDNNKIVWSAVLEAIIGNFKENSK